MTVPHRIAQRLHRHSGQRGQSLAEFVIVVPVLLALVGAALDVARLYFTWIDLEAATRDAAQAIASYVGADDTTNNLYNYYDPTSLYYQDMVTGGTCVSDAAAAAILHTETGFTFNATAPARAGTYCKDSLPSLASCTTPQVVTSWWYDTSSASGGGVSYPAITVEVRACYPFRTLFAYPFITHNGDWVLRSDRTVKTLLGR